MAGLQKSVYIDPNSGPYYSIDVECVATGYGHNDRAVAQISLVNQQEVVVLDLFVKPDCPVVSYLTDLTGITADLLDKHGITLDSATRLLKKALCKEAILVGQSISHDTEWLGLVEGQHFKGLLDLTGIWRCWNPRYKSYTSFSLSHEASVLLGVSQSACHNACEDATLSIRLFNYYLHLQSAGDSSIDAAKTKLLSTPISPSFAKRNPTYENVCMGHRKACRCGSAFCY